LKKEMLQIRYPFALENGKKYIVTSTLTIGYVLSPRCSNLCVIEIQQYEKCFHQLVRF
jgi:hypothetical protein